MWKMKQSEYEIEETAHHILLKSAKYDWLHTKVLEIAQRKIIKLELPDLFENRTIRKLLIDFFERAKKNI